jgi:hypothetical protein
MLEFSRQEADFMKRIAWFVVVVATLIGSGWLVTSVMAWRADRQQARFNEDIESLFLALQKYKEHVGAYPVGSNAEVARALSGRNPKNVIIAVARKQIELNDKGEFVDPWGTPLALYFSGSSVLVRSAGPNRRFDDSTIKDGDDYFRSN